MPCQSSPHQLDLFASPGAAEIAQTPPWHTLPLEARQTLTQLMVRLILDHAGGHRAPKREGMPCDV